jgi:hypothetical protein
MKERNLICFMVISFSVLNACKKQEPLGEKPLDEKPIFDLYPLKVGNKFYYKYEYKFINGPIDGWTKGTEIWKVLSESAQGNLVIYSIERKLNAIQILNGLDKTVISDRISSFTISKSISDSLLLSNFGFNYGDIKMKKYQHDSIVKIQKEGGTSSISWSFLFKADSGLTKYSYYHPPNYMSSESLVLDSLKNQN